MNNRSKTFAAIGAIAIIATVTICLICIKDWSGLTTLAFVFLLWAEVVFFGSGMLVERISAKSEGIITSSSWYIIGSVYSGIVFLLSLFNLGNHSTQSKWFWMIQIILIAVTLIALFLFSSVSKEVHRANNKTESLLNSFSSTVSRLALLSERVTDVDQATLLKKLSEELRFTDATAVVEADTKIENAVSAIELEIEKSSPDSSAIENSIAAINSAIKERKVQLTTAKRGRI